MIITCSLCGSVINGAGCTRGRKFCVWLKEVLHSDDRKCFFLSHSHRRAVTADRIAIAIVLWFTRCSQCGRDCSFSDAEMKF